MNGILGELYYQHIWWGRKRKKSEHAQLPEGLVMIRWSSMMAPNIFTPRSPSDMPSLSISPSLCMTTSVHLQIAATARDHGEEQRHPVADAYLNRVSAHKTRTAELTCLQKRRRLLRLSLWPSMNWAGAHSSLRAVLLRPISFFKDPAQFLRPAPFHCLPYLQFGLICSTGTRSACSCQPGIHQG